MSNVCLIVLIGLPASGKTTFANTLYCETKNFVSNCEVLTFCYDHLLQHDEHTKRLRNTIEKTVDELIPKLSAKTSKTIIIIDDNMYYRSMRKVYHKIAKKYQVGYMQVYFETNFDVISERNINRCENEQIPRSIIEKMAQKMEKPNIKSTWEKNTVFLNVDTCNGDFLITFFEILKHSFEQPVSSNNRLEEPELINNGTKTNETLMHKVDLTLRKIVGEKCRMNPTLAGVYSERKKHLFKFIKDKILTDEKLLSNSAIYDYLKTTFEN